MFVMYFIMFFFGQPLSDLGHDDFSVRDKATQLMKDQFPASLPALYSGLYSSDPEIKYRSTLILREKKADSVLMAKKLNNDNIKKILSMDRYPEFKDSDFLKDCEQWLDFCDVLIHFNLYDPKKEIISQNNREGVVWIMWARAKCVRYGKDPKVGSSQMPEIIRPGQEPKKNK